MADKKLEQTKEEIMKELEEVKGELVEIKDDISKGEIIDEIKEVKDDIEEMKDELIEEIKADEARSKNKSLVMWFIGVFIILVLVVSFFYYNKKNADENKTESKPLDFITKYIPFMGGQSSIPKEEAANKAFDFIKKYLAPGMEMEIANIEDQKYSFYKFTVKSGEQEIPTYVSVDGKSIIYNEVDITKDPTAATNTQQGGTTKVDGKDVISSEGGFQEVQGAEVCKESGKPIIYFFGSESCPHCKWQKPVIQAVVKEYGNKISYHENIDNEKDLDLFIKYNPSGTIPTIIIGCKYFRIGSGEGSGEEADKLTLKNMIDNVLK